MGHYKSNLRDIEFNLFEVLGADAEPGPGALQRTSTWTPPRTSCKEVERLCSNDLAASFVEGDRNPPVFDKDTGTVTLPGRVHQELRDLPRGRLGQVPAAARSSAASAPRRR